MQQIGKYRVVRLIGEGGMGRVYEALDPMINRRVAIKTISQNVLDSPEARGRFVREAQAAGQLSHPNLITIHDIAEDNGVPFIVMEYLEGEELTSIIAKGRLALDVKLRLMIDVCKGLAYAHAKGLVHRDIKPANIFVTKQQQVKILDFGLARGLVSDLTQTGNVVGTPSYMAPEQVRGEPIDQRADIFSAGVVLYEFLSGRKPFKGDSVAALVYQVLQHEPQRINELDPNLPPELTDVVERALAKDPAARFQSIDEMLDDLAQIKTMAESTVLLNGPPLGADRPSSGAPARPSGSMSTAGKSGARPTARPSVSNAAARRSSATPAGSADMSSAATVLQPVPAAVAESEPRPASTPSQARSAVKDPTPLPAPPPAAPAASWATAVGVLALAAVAIVLVIGRVTSRSAPTDAHTAPAPLAPAPAAATTGPAAVSSAPAPVDTSASSPARPAVEPSRGAPAPSPPGGSRDITRSAATAPAVPASPAASNKASAPTPTAAPLRTVDAAPSPAREVTPPAPVASAATAPTAPPPVTAAPSAAPPPPASPLPAAVAAPAPAPTPAPPPAPVENSGAAIQDVLARYKSALETRDLAALKQIWPGLSGRQESAIKAEFDNSRTIAVTLKSISPTITKDTATVVCRREYVVTTTDRRTLNSATRMTMTLDRKNGAWQIDNIRHDAER